MLRKAIIWRESVYKDDFRCNQCKRYLADASGHPMRDILTSMDETMLFCPYCKNYVAHVVDVNVPEGMKGLGGSWDEFIKSQED